ncbi:MAG: 23S rRNA (uracil(1939)-C(5))-methyltransferase RlmD [Candidatus Cloacimonetes bacterium]|nr:23S rRNA (uracil(1939)-C(5))-methyltransferase RlmD [Candidatus Cloacimonadota bacterium]
MIYKTEITDPLKIVKKVYQGYGFSEWQGKKIFVHYGIPGDKLRARIITRKKDYLLAEVEEVIEASSARIEAGCAAFGKCGGCDWLNIHYQNQLGYKEDILDEIFQKIPGEAMPIQGCVQRTHYRNKCFYPLTMRNGKPVYGIYARGTHEVIEHNNCQLQPVIFDKLAEAFCQYIINSHETVYNEKNGIGNILHLGFRIAPESGELLLIIVTYRRRLAFTNLLIKAMKSVYPQIRGIIQNINPDPGNMILGREHKLIDGDNFLQAELAGRKFELNYDAFFQVNREAATAMLDFCREYVNPETVLIDAYCGTGTIGICLADKAAKVIGIDNSRAAIKNARNSVKLNGISNAEFLTGDTAALIAGVISNHKPDLIIFDPPRSGLAAETISAVCTAAIPRIIYISCDPSTQHRDLRLFIQAGYELRCRKGFDMFPQTWHIENVLILEKK